MSENPTKAREPATVEQANRAVRAASETLRESLATTGVMIIAMTIDGEITTSTNMKPWLAQHVMEQVLEKIETGGIDYGESTQAEKEGGEDGKR
ncbi:MAG TPA: hypothetical protein VHQ92_11050 [Pseudolabrys sp.]|jgi:hypothetical protein|nr:hypothetical protein [Pseudolabrys sp.]